MDWDGITSTFLIPFFAGYLAGSIPFGLILSYMFGYGDIRKIGSGNIGATNALRTGNKKLALATLILDGSKGAAIILIVFAGIPASKEINSYFFSTEFLIFISTIYALGAVIGHCFPVWLKFKGGKGVATALGALLVAVPYAGLAACAAWIITAFIFRISSLAALVAIGVAPIITLIIYGQMPAIICALITILVWVRHRNNIKRMISGQEPKIGRKKGETPKETSNKGGE